VISLDVCRSDVWANQTTKERENKKWIQHNFTSFEHIKYTRSHSHSHSHSHSQYIPHVSSTFDINVSTHTPTCAPRVTNNPRWNTIDRLITD
jgi:hypothetical protein